LPIVVDKRVDRVDGKNNENSPHKIERKRMTGFFPQVVNIFGKFDRGSAVIGSYIYGIATHPGKGTICGEDSQGVRTI
jgi:hypothetical protein